MINAINYFFEETPSAANEYFRAYFDFETTNTSSSVINNKSGTIELSGVIKPSVGNFWQLSSGSGYLSGNRYIHLSGLNNVSGFDTQDLTIALVYDNRNVGGATLISTSQTGSFLSYDQFGSPKTSIVYKGFEFGVTDNNKLFFEYYNNGPNIFVSDFTLSDKNSVYLSISENNISFGYYDFFRNRLVSNENYISTEYLFDYSNMFIGYNPLASGLYNFNKSYTGFVDTFVLFSPSIYEYDLVTLNSGIGYLYNTGQISIETTLITGITGYETGITGYSQEQTGVVLLITGTAINEWGVEYTGYLESGLSGSVPIFGPSGVTGILALEQITGITGSGIFKNTNYLNFFGKKNINLLYKVNSNDLIELNLNTDSQNVPIYKNIKLNYQPYEDNFVDSENLRSSSTPIVYMNGQLADVGSFYETGDAYNLSRYIINDYYIDDNDNFIFANNYNESDNIIADYIYEEPTESSLYKFKQKLSGLREVAAEGFYGWNNAINNNETTILMGGLGTGPAATGGVLIFTGDSINRWSVRQKLTGDSASDRFGVSVSINTGNVIVIGATVDGGSNSGSCFVFTGDSINGWNFRQKLTGDSAQASNGNSNTINNDGTIIVMGANLNDIPFANGGGAFIYTGNPSLGWNFRQKLTGTFAQLNLGSSVAMNSNGNTIALGGHSSTYNSGLVFIYTGSSNGGWILKQTISGLENQALGSSVDMTENGEIILIGAKGQLSTLNGSGLIYTGNSNVGWSLAQIISGDEVGNFGQSVSITNNGNTVLVYGKTSQNNIALIYTGNSNLGWEFKQKIIQAVSNPGNDSHSTSIISPSGNVVIIGDRYDNSNTGSASIYNLDNNNLYTVNDNFIINSGSGFYNLTGYTSDIYNVYFNGQKLISGLHYQSSPLGYIQFNQNSYYYTGVSGKLTLLKELIDFRSTGSGNLFKPNTPYFLSEIYKNGVRQILNLDYLELGDLSSNNGTGFFDQNTDVIYNNDQLFNI